MKSPRLYLDHAATSPLRPEARQAMERCWTCTPGNAASAHVEGRAARAVLERARAQVAALVGARPEEVYFTSGATEATNLALRGAAQARRDARRHLVSTRIEHAAGLRVAESLACAGWKVTLLESDATGRIDPRSLSQDPMRNAALVSVIAAHNEIGTVQPLGDLAAAAHAGGAALHLDAVQAASSMDLGEVPWDLLSLSGHKLGGPQGVGALVVRGSLPLAPVLVGGTQESGLRPGTVPVALAAGFGAAAEAAFARRESEAHRLSALRDRLAGAIRERFPRLVPLGASWTRPGSALPHVLAFGVDDARGDELVGALDEAGVAASSAAACTGSARSHVLDALGVPEHVGMLRLSLGWSTTAVEIDAAAGRVAEALSRLLAMTPFERRRRPFATRAAEAGVALTPLHWEAAEAVFTFHMQKGVLPGARHLARALGPGVELESLFPKGLATLAAWLGIPAPDRGCRPHAV